MAFTKVVSMRSYVSRARCLDAGGFSAAVCQAFSKATAAAFAAAADAESFNTGKLSGRAKSVCVHRFLAISRFCNRLPSAALPSLK